MNSIRGTRTALLAATMLAPFVGAAWSQEPPTSLTQPPAAQPAALAAEAPAAAANAPAAAAAPVGALQVLLEQANFWRGQQRYDQALASLARAGKLAPDDPELLAVTAQIQTEAGNRQAAAAALARLRQVAPDDARIAKLDQSIRVGPIAPEALDEARRLAKAGKNADAIDRYNRVLKGSPPPDAMAIEYYQTLAGTDAGWQSARDALARLVRQDPNDLHTQLAYAQVLTYRDTGRAEGISRLAALAQNPEVAEQATQSWRQALSWLPDDKSAIELLAGYLAVHPDDGSITAKLESARNPLLKASPPVRARIEGFAALNKGKPGDAEKLFQQAIDADPNDADATGGLGLVRLRQGRFADAKALLSRAIAIDPDHKGRWQQALSAAANPGGGPNPAVALINHGDFPAAERELARQIAHGGDVTGLQVMLADAQARQGHLDSAEASYRAALARAPNNAQALVGLAGVVSRQGRAQEASDLLDRAQASGAGKQVGRARALQLREQANAITDPATQAGLYRAAIAADPDNPWIRLDFARVLVKLGQVPDARTVMAEVIGSHPSDDALKAGIIFANETSDPDAAAALIARLPPTLRTPEMRSLQAQAAFQREIGAALMLPREAARQRLLTLSAAPDPDGARGAAIAHALAEIGSKTSVREAIITAQAATPGQPGGARLRYAGALLDAGDSAGAQAMLGQVGSDLTAQQRQDLIQMQAGLAVRASDELNEKGQQAQAYDKLAPVLAQAPDNPDLNLALARLYQGAKNPKEALQIAQSVLRREPSNMEARRGAVSAALALGDRSLAGTLVEEGRQLAPNDPKVWIMSADVDRAGGFVGRALSDLQRARDLRQQQLGFAGGTPASGAPTLSGVSLVPGAAPSYLPAAPQQPAYRNPFPPQQRQPNADAGADGGADGGADQPTDLSLPPLQAPPADPAPPFAPHATNAMGAAPSYQPTGSVADQLNAQELGRRQAANVFGTAPEQQVADQPPAFQVFGTPPAPQFAQTQSFYNNPFRQAPGGDRSDPASLPATTGLSDPETQEIDKTITALRETLAPTADIGFGYHSRSGSAGLDALTELTTPMEATYSPGGYGKLKLSVTPTWLSAGTLGGNPINQQRFGSNALELASNGTTPVFKGIAPGDQSAQGVGLDLGYTIGSLTADAGVTPLGLREQSVLGGVEYAPALTDNLRLRLTAERRAVTDSLLAYGGAVDPRSGETWGGVTRDHAKANFELTEGLANFYLGGGGETLSGAHVASNTEYEFGAGGNVPVWRDATAEIRAGLDLVYFGYAKNLRYFSLGQGGYFSPQSYMAALIPVTYKDKVSENLSYEIGGSAGFQDYRENASAYFPDDPALQAQLVAQQANPGTAVTGLLTQYPSDKASGFTGNAHAAIDYRVSTNLHLGGRFDYEHSGNFDDASGVVYAKYVFSSTGK